jgi:hypothetical protein
MVRRPRNMYLKLLILPLFKPIGGDGDGVMDRKEEARWAPNTAVTKTGIGRLLTISFSRRVLLQTTGSWPQMNRWSRARPAMEGKESKWTLTSLC